MQPMAIRGRSPVPEDGGNKRNPLPPSATGCLRRSMVRNLMKEGLPRSETPRVLERRREAPRMLYVGLDLSRKRLDWLALDPQGEPTAIGSVAPDRDGLVKLGQRLGDAAVLAVIESMSGARFVHDQLELAGWDVRIADAF